MVDRHYLAFLSYSHRDREAGERLHRKLESYRVPKKLVGSLTGEGSVPRRLTPIFRDREELATSGDLSTSVEKALKRSHFLLVLCSKSAAQSEWVNKEILRFKAMCGEDHLLGVIIDSEENAGVDVAEALFPPALRFRIGPDGALTDVPAEPLAADLRESGDGPKYGFLKIVAGLIGVGLDDLIQREQGRRNTEMKVMTGTAMAAAFMMGGLAWLAVDARNEAEMQKTEAEGLIEFMLTELKGKLESVGRLDALDTTGKRALEYYAAQDPDRLDADSLTRRARAQLLLGEIDQRRNDLAAALEAYEAAAATTSELLRRAPNNAERVFNHAQSIFWVGAVAHQRGQMGVAEEQFREYLRLAEKLIAIDNEKPEWRMELAYATSNLGAIKFEQGDFDDAASFFAQSVVARKALIDKSDNEEDTAFAYAYALSWKALAELAKGNFRQAIETMETQLSVYDKYGGRDGENFRLLEPMAIAHRRIAEARLSIGDVDGATTAMKTCEEITQKLLARDDENADWKRNAVRAWQLKSRLALLAGDRVGAVAASETALRSARELVDGETSIREKSDLLGVALATRVAVGDQSDRRIAAAVQLGELFEQAQNTDENHQRGALAVMAQALSDYERKRGEEPAARRYAEAGLAALRADNIAFTAAERFVFVELCTSVSNDPACVEEVQWLDLQGFKHPDFITLVQNSN